MNEIIKYNKARGGTGGSTGGASASALALSTLANYITQNQLADALADYLPRVEFEELFEKVTLASGAVAIRAKYGLYSEAFISTLGPNPDAGIAAAGATTLGGLSNVAALADDVTTSDKILVRGAGDAGWTLRNLSDVAGLDTAALSQYLTANSYAKVSDIPSLANYVDKTSAQEISGAKTFTAADTYFGSHVIINGASTDYASYPHLKLHIPNVNYVKFQMDTTGAVHVLSGGDTNWTSYKSIKAASFVRYGGTSSQFLKADGSVDGNSYALASALGNYLPLTGGTLTGALNFGSTNCGIYNSDSLLALKAGDGLDKLVIAADAVRRSTQTAAVNLGTAAVRWSTVYANAINVTSTTVVSNLNADLLDGVHNGEVTARYLSWKGFTNASEIDFSSTGWSANGACADIPTFSYLAGITIGSGFNRAWQLFSGRNARRIYYRNSKSDMTGWDDTIKSIAFLDDNVASATKLQTARTLTIGNAAKSFDGSGDVSWSLDEMGALSKATFDDLFVKESDGKGGYRIRAKYAFYTNEWMSCKGANPDAGTATGGVDLAAVQAYLTQQGYATQAWVQSQGYLTSANSYLTKTVADTLYQAKGSYVTLDTEQEISGKKTFTAEQTAVTRRLYVNGAYDAFNNYPHYMWHVGNTRWTKAVMDTNGHIHFVDGGATGFNTYRTIKALSFVVNGGTSSQFLKADGSVDSNAYSLTSHNHDAAYVKKAGDTMTGVLNIAHNSTNRVIQTQYNTAGDYSNVIFATVDDSRVIFGSPVWATVELETSNSAIYRRTAGVTYKIWDSGNDGTGSGLDADLLDGLHNGELNAKFLDVLDTRDIDTLPNAYNKGISYHFRRNGVDGLSCGGDFHSVLHFAQWADHTGGKTKQLALGDNGRMYIRYAGWVDTAWSAWNTIAFTSDNVASATKLQTARKIYGVDFDGSGNVNGAFHWVGTDATLRIYEIASAVDSSYGNETIGIQSCFDGQDGLTSVYPPTWPARTLIALQPRGGRVAIGKTSADYLLDVNGDMQANGWLRTIGNKGWYNQTHGGGWYMEDATWIKAWQKPVYIAYGSPIGPGNYNVGLKLYNSAYTSMEVQGGDYTMGLGCHSNGSWHWWRGTASGKSYVMTYNGTTWSFTGVIKTSTGMYSDGYMSCLGQNTGSDIRLKNIIGDAVLTLDMIADAPAKLFTWRSGPFAGRMAVGTIAQYWQTWLPAVVSKRPDDYLQMDYGVTALTATINLARITRNGLTDHERRIAALEAENQQLKNRINELERRSAA